MTNAAWLALFTALSVTSVTRHYDNPPTSLSTADLPALYIQAPGGGRPTLTVSCVGNNKTRSMDVVIAVEPVGQSITATIFAALAALTDNLETALDALNVNILEYDITAGVLVTIAGVDYWAIVANVRGRDV